MLIHRSGWLTLTILIGLIILLPGSNLQGYLSSGDHGRDLYAFSHAFRGLLPYHDYWWDYGPLMPYYYGLFMLVFGTSVKTVLLAATLLYLAAGIMLQKTVARLTHPACGLAAAAWFWSLYSGFFFTYNHIGGILCLTTLAYALTSYTHTRKPQPLALAAAAAGTLVLIKLNQGAAAITITAAAIALSDRLFHPAPDARKKFFWPTLLIGIPLLTASIHFLLLRGLSADEIRECFHYSPSDQQYNMSIINAIRQLWGYFQSLLHTDRLTLAMSTLTIMSFGRVLWLSTQKKISAATTLSAVFLGLLYAAAMHEYLKSGILYRYNWSQPLWIILMFTLIGTAAASLSRTWKYISAATVTLLVLIAAFTHISNIRTTIAKTTMFHHPKVQSAVLNGPDWIPAVTNTLAFLNRNLAPDEKFFALPYDPLYYYLSGRTAPTRQTIFFQHINIPPTQEQRVIADLERNHVNWIVLSTRYRSREAGLGNMGTDYCPMLARYINEHFTAAEQFGDWMHEPGWAWAHGTVVLKRNQAGEKD